MSEVRPIEIVGGGLAGLSLGLALRYRGVPVTVLEAGSYPRHRVCGEFITGLSPKTIKTLGLEAVLAGAPEHREVAWFHRDRPLPIQRLPSPAIGVSRYTLDARLAAAFLAAGGTLRTGVRAPLDAAAPGRIFAAGRAVKRSEWIGLKFHVTGFKGVRDLELHLGEQAYVGLSAVEDGEVNVCGLFAKRDVKCRDGDLLLGYLAASGLSGLAARLRAAALVEDSFCAVAGLGFGRAKPDGRATIGDAHGMPPPFTGNGMAMAFQGAETAVGPLAGYAKGKFAWTEAVSQLRRELDRRFAVRLASARLLHPFLLNPKLQGPLAGASRTRLLPLKALYALLH
jgi:hypothetical protein